MSSNLATPTNVSVRHHSFVDPRNYFDYAFELWKDPRLTLLAAASRVPEPSNGSSDSNLRIGEIADLRTPPYNKDRASHCSYEPRLASHQIGSGQQLPSRIHDQVVATKTSTTLPTKTQSRFISAAYVGFTNGCPLNAILTVNWSKLPEDADTYWSTLHPYDRAKSLVENPASGSVEPGHQWAREDSRIEPSNDSAHECAVEDHAGHQQELSGFDQSIATMFGHMTSFIAEPTTAKPSGR